MKKIVIKYAFYMHWYDNVFYDIKILNIYKKILILNTIKLETSEPKWVNPVLNTIVVDSLWIGGLQIYYSLLRTSIESTNVWNINIYNNKEKLPTNEPVIEKYYITFVEKKTQI